MAYLVTIVRGLSLVADNVHSADHLADGEESDEFRSGDTSQGDLLCAGIADAGQDGLGGVAQVLERGGVGKTLEVGLEGGHGAEGVSRVMGDQTRRAYGGVIFWPRNTSLPTSRPTFE